MHYLAFFFSFKVKNILRVPIRFTSFLFAHKSMSALCVVSGGSRGGARGGGGRPPIFLDQTGVRGPKKYFLEPAPPHLGIWMTAPTPLSQGLDRALVVGGMLFLPPWFFRYKGVGYTRAESHCTLFLTLCSFLREAVARNGIWYIDCEQSLLFFRFGKGSARARERWAVKLRDARREKQGRQPLPSRTFSHARGHLRVSGVLLDGPRKKRDCS